VNLPKEYISHSQIGMFLRCPKQYEFRYLQDIVAPPSGALVLGKSGHNALAYNFEQKIESHKDLKPKEIVEFFANDYDTAVKNEEPVFDGESKEELKDSGVKILKKYPKEHGYKIQPVAVEKEFNVKFKNAEFGFKGFIDLVTDECVIKDHKFSKRNPNQADIDDALQACAYYLGYRTLFNADPAGFDFDYLITKKEPEIKTYPTKRNDEDIAEYLELVRNVANAIRAGNFYKNTSGWHCNQKFCGYFDKCRPHRTKFTLI
jgi:CRISPR/Cas system-associated exonuclease Cas4 (RecB family)